MSELKQQKILSKQFSPAVALLLILPLQSQAQLSPRPTLEQCQALSDQGQRYACYDQMESSAAVITESEVLSPGQNLTETARQVEQSEPEPAGATVANFGRRTPAAERSTARVMEDLDGNEQLVDSIASIREREPNRRLITLQSGQVWYQVNSQRINLRPGMEVTIYPSPWGGSYRMRSEDLNRFIQVRRVE